MVFSHPTRIVRSLSGRVRRMAARQTGRPLHHHRKAVSCESLEGRRLLSAAISNVVLYNADNDQPIMTLSDGATLNLASLPTRRLNIVAQPSSSTGSIKFQLDNTVKIESIAPYALWGDAWPDRPNDLNAWTPSVGSHKLQITAYSGAGANGSAGPTKTINFNVVDGNTGPNVTRLMLYNTDTDQPIQQLTNGQTINLSSLSSRNLSIVAETSGSTSRVIFNFDGRTVTENIPAYALGGNDGNDFHPYPIGVGTHSLTATAYSSNGQAGGSQTITFSVVDQAPSNGGISGLMLYNADNNQPIMSLANGATINYANLPTRNLSIVAQTSGDVRSVRFGLDGNSSYATENIAPFAIAGDDNGNLNAWRPSAGNHTVTATAYGGNGQTLGSMTISFTVVDGNSSPAPGSGAEPNPVITVQKTTIYPGHAVHVHAMESTLGAGTDITARYEWDFGDPNGRYNKLVGFNAAHLYENPGTYTITLKITNENGVSATRTTQITVRPETRRTIYVAANGNDSNDGLSSSRPVKSLWRIQELLNHDTRVLLRRGDTFDWNTKLAIRFDNVLIGAYGSGAQPVVRTTTANQDHVFRTYDETDNVTIRDITIDSAYGWNLDYAGGAVGIQPDGRNIAGVDLTFRNVSSAVNGEDGPQGFLLLGSKATSVTSVRAYGVWAAGSDYVVLGNEIPNSTREHILRLGGLSRLLAHDNTFANIGGTDSLDIEKTVMALQTGTDLYISGNHVIKGEIGMGPLGGSAGSNHAEARTVDVVVEGNVFENGLIGINPGTVNAFIRNNVIRRDGSTAINITADEAGYSGRKIQNITIANNTGINYAVTGGRMINLHESTNAQITLVNNLYVAPHMEVGAFQAANVYVSGNDLSSFKLITNNVWASPTILGFAEGGLHYVYPYWSSKAGYQTPAEWSAFPQVQTEYYENVTLNSLFAPGAGTLAARVAIPVKGVQVDMYGNPRPFSNIAVGAVEV
jgi:PKD repeat protein